MVRLSILPAAAVTLFLFGVEASPCKPSTTAVTSIAESSSTAVPDSTATSSHSVAITTLIDATTTVQEEETTTTTETSVAESVSTIASDTTIASVGVTTTTAAQEEPATTTGAPDCAETQLFTNPNFDNGNDNITPWTSNGGITHTSPQSGTNAVSFTWYENGYRSGSVQQSLSNLYGTYEFSYYYRLIYASAGADYTCDMELKVGDTSLQGNFNYWQGGWQSGSVIFYDVNVAQADVQLIASCGGEFHEIQVAVDTLAFKRICSV